MLFRSVGRYAAGFAIREALDVLKRDGNFKAIADRMLTMQQYNEVLGTGEFAEWESRYLR